MTMTITQEAIFAYGSRRKLLAEMGYDSYEAYLASDLWQRIRLQVLRSGNCYGCDGKSTQVHHRSYSRKALSGRRLDSLVPICASCHELIEFKNGIKVSPQEANESLEAIRRNRPIPGPRPIRAKKPTADRKEGRSKRRKQKKPAQPTWVPPSFVANPNCVQQAQESKRKAKQERRAKHEAMMAERARIKKENAMNEAAKRIAKQALAAQRAARPPVQLSRLAQIACGRKFPT